MMSVDMDINEGVCCEDFWSHLAGCLNGIDDTIDDVKEKLKEIVLTGLCLFIGVPCAITLEIIKKIT